MRSSGAYNPRVAGAALAVKEGIAPVRDRLVTTAFLAALFHGVVILGITDRRAPAGFAPMGIGLCLTLIHLISIPVTNTSVNPARSTGPAVFVGGWALKQLWLFWFAPIAGAVIAGYVYRLLWEKKR